MASPCITRVLPSELLARVFSFLSERQDIAACRLVSHAFHELSSPFLIANAVFALRLDELTRLRELMQHPYFSRYVSTLIYDASRYSQETSTDWNDYVLSCEDSPRARTDEAWAVRNRHEEGLIDSFVNLNVSRPPPDSASARSTSLQDAVADADGPDTAAEHFRMGRYYEIVYQMGCQRTFPDYYRRYKTQAALIRRGAHAAILAEVFKAFPKLRHVHFTDYRGLAKPAETFSDCCKRLFGLTLEPQHLNISEIAWKDIATIFRAAAASQARIEAFTVGPHRYASVRPIMSSSLGDANVPEMLPLGVFHNFKGQDFALLETALAALHTVAFSYNEPVAAQSSATLGRIFAALGPDLQNLTVAHAIERDSPQYETDPGIVEYPLLDFSFPRLHYLELRHLQLHYMEPLQEFLERHSSTLREVRLIEYCVTDRAGEQDKFAHWAAENLHLIGVEIMTPQDLQALLGASQMLQKKKSEACSRRNFDEMMKVLRPIEARESTWLCGRPNTLRRTVDIAQKETWAQMGESWWLQPARS